jgi:hypothetical protein
MGEFLRPILLVWLLLAALSNVPYLLAELAPPQGRAFVGFFYYVDDAYNYLSYVEQAEHGALVFVNKLVLDDHAPGLVNLEWALVGRLSALLGSRPALAYRAFGAAALLALVGGVAAWLHRAGLPASHRAPALLLVFTAAGMGGFRFELLDRPLNRCLDLLTGMFPVLESLANPHFVAGTALLGWALWAFSEARSVGGAVVANLLGTALGLVRPYELVLLVVIRAASVCLTTRPPAWIRGLLPLAGLLPVTAYNAWVFGVHPAFRQLATLPYGRPPLSDFAWALLPAAALASSGLIGMARSVRTPRLTLALWAAVILTIVAWWPVPFSLQFVVGIGAPLLMLGALGLARFRPAVTVAVALALSPTGLAALRLVSQPDPQWFVPRERIDAARALREVCAPGDRLFSPPDIGMLAAGLSSCRPFISHPVVPDYAARSDSVRAFFEAWDPATRARFLDAHRITHLALAGDATATLRQWLGEGTPFREVARVGAGAEIVLVCARRPTAGAPPKGEEKPQTERRERDTPPEPARPKPESDLVRAGRNHHAAHPGVDGAARGPRPVDRRLPAGIPRLGEHEQGAPLARRSHRDFLTREPDDLGAP